MKLDNFLSQSFHSRAIKKIQFATRQLNITARRYMQAKIYSRGSGFSDLMKWMREHGGVYINLFHIHQPFFHIEWTIQVFCEFNINN